MTPQLHPTPQCMHNSQPHHLSDYNNIQVWSAGSVHNSETLSHTRMRTHVHTHTHRHTHTQHTHAHAHAHTYTRTHTHTHTHTCTYTHMHARTHNLATSTVCSPNCTTAYLFGSEGHQCSNRAGQRGVHETLRATLNECCLLNGQHCLSHIEVTDELSL